MAFCAFCPVNTVSPHFPSENDAEFNSWNELEWHSHYLFQPCKMSLTQDINYWELSLCQTHNQHRNLILTSKKGKHYLPIPLKSYLLSGVTSGCHFQPVFVTECRDLWSKILDYKEILVKVYLSPEQFVSSSVTLRMEGLLAHTEAWGEPQAIPGKDKNDTPLHCQVCRTPQHPLVHPFFHRPNTCLLYMCNMMNIVQVTSWAAEMGKHLS